MFLIVFFSIRDKLSFVIDWMPHLSSNTRSTSSYPSIFSELLWIARFTLRTNDFIPGASDLWKKGGNRAKLTKELKKAFHSYPTVQKSGKTDGKVNTSIMKNT